MSYYHAKRSHQAKGYLDARDIEQRAAAARDEAQLNKSRAWLEQYRTATTKPNDTPDAKEIKEAEPQQDRESWVGEAASGERGSREGG